MELKVGAELRLDCTTCHEIRNSRQPVLFGQASSAGIWDGNANPPGEGVPSYISLPITLPDGSLFGTLCAIDPRPAHLKETAALGPTTP
jgi:GAF domain-containing protein